MSSTSVSDESIPDIVSYPRQKQCLECQETFTVPSGQSYHQTTICSRICGETLPCGHSCVGQCGDCTSSEALLQQYELSIFIPKAYVVNVAHHPCMHVCNRTQPCGHLCNAVCCKNCPPCGHPCECPQCVVSRGTSQRTQERRGTGAPPPSYVCSKCPYRGKCGKPCGWRCPHHQCFRPCSAPCLRVTCNRRCTKRLDSCGHRCVGVCGESCPPFCPACYRGEAGEERKKAQMELASTRLHVDEVFLCSDNLEEFCNGELLEDSESDEKEEVVGKENGEGGEEHLKKEGTTASHLSSTSVVSSSDTFDYSLIEMPCCGKMLCVGFLDGTFRAAEFSEEEQETGAGKELQLLACPLCRKALPYPCAHFDHDTFHAQELQMDHNAGRFTSESSLSISSSSCAENGTFMALRAPFCIYRYSKLQKEKVDLVNKVCEKQHSAWEERQKRNSLATLRVVNGLLNPKCALHLRSKEGSDNAEVEKLFIDENEKTIRVREFHKKREEIIQSKLSLMKTNGKLQKNMNGEGGQKLPLIEEWRDRFFSLVKSMMLILLQAQHRLPQSERNCFLWWVLLCSPDDPSTHAVAGALLNLVFATPSSNSEMWKGRPEREKLFNRIQDTMVSYGHYILENFFTVNERMVQKLSTTMEWLRCILMALVRSSPSLTSSTCVHAMALARHRQFFGTLFLPSADILAFWDEKKIDIPELCEMITSWKALVSDIVTVDFLKTIMNPLGLTAGHFFTCPNGHIYAVGECGGTMQESICPDCKARIGGTQHKLLSDNYSFAKKIDKNATVAWSTVTQRYA